MAFQIMTGNLFFTRQFLQKKAAVRPILVHPFSTCLPTCNLSYPFYRALTVGVATAGSKT